MSDLISRQAAIEKLKRMFNETDAPDHYPGIFDALEEWLSELELPPHPEREKTKRVIKGDGTYGYYVCGNCGAFVSPYDVFCSRCGDKFYE